MKIKFIVVIIVFFQTLNFQCGEINGEDGKVAEKSKVQKPGFSTQVIVGAERLQRYLPVIAGKKIAMMVNQTSRLGGQHLVDTLLRLNVQIEKIFAPEHGFRGTADAGEKLQNGLDAKTGIPVISLYGRKRKPSPEDLRGIAVVLFDIQDVGARFYTFISSMHHVMEACAENEVEFLVLDRPNPNGHYVDGPVLNKSHQSFVGMDEVPVVHGMTVAEYARMLNGEGWLSGGRKCRLEWVACQNYNHQTRYYLPVKPSPNLPNMRAIYLYPSLCFFEGTVVSVGRGTDKQFQIFGAPKFQGGNFSFVPQPMAGAKYPKHQGEQCFGYDLTKLKIEDLEKRNSLNMSYLIDFYNTYPDKENFFLKNLFFDKLAGGTKLREQIVSGKSKEEIRVSWQKKLADFQTIRKKYLLYPDFE